MDYNKIRDLINSKDKFLMNHGIRVVKMDKGYAEVEMEIEDHNLNSFGILHGGVYYTLADSIAGLAAISCGISSVTLSGSLNFISSVKRGKIIAIAEEINRRRKIGIYEVKIYDQEHILAAEGTFTMYFTGHALDWATIFNSVMI
ncbi:PaaI family thioesterase [Dehalobacterium formicoaceticum]|uniref:PaaI family thioesterase n=1 Tax=Dehalobacterium formicoaceticum TaxID=51515 RepID=A0ABT1Y7V3_9FIRM|nr:PaaI family thioesterase [Dehalobacterium formicoaceticum]MCR6546957.1 PaaI family thioesterase [Dehalobacterium formicoaceticum]